MGMKKCVFFCLLLMATVVGCIEPDGLRGTWETKEGDATMRITFHRDSCDLQANIKQTDNKIFTIYMTLKVPGSYTVEDSVMKLKYYPEQLEASLDKIELFKPNPELEKKVREAFEEVLENKETLAESFPKMENVIIVKQTETDLWLKDKKSGIVSKLTRCDD